MFISPEHSGSECWIPPSADTPVSAQLETNSGKNVFVQGLREVTLEKKADDFVKYLGFVA
jgi:hypothetical protein